MLHGELLELLEFYVVAEKHVLVLFFFLPMALSYCTLPLYFTESVY